MLRFYEDLSEADIADVLGMAAGTVKSHCHAGCQRLAGLLENPAAFTTEKAGLMTIEDRIRESAHRFAGATEPPMPDMDSIRSRARHNRKRRQMSAAVALAAVIATAVGLRILLVPTPTTVDAGPQSAHADQRSGLVRRERLAPGRQGFRYRRRSAFGLPSH